MRQGALHEGSHQHLCNKQPVATLSQITQLYETSIVIVSTKLQCNITVRIVVHNAKCVAIKICMYIIVHYILHYCM